MEGLIFGILRYLSRRLVSPPVLFRAMVVLYHVSDIFRVTVDVMGGRSDFPCRVECV